VKNYKELEVWQLAKELATHVYRVTATFPQSERFGLTSQARRAATSVPANIAEGWGRGTAGECIQFLLITRGSLMEVETHLIIAQELGYLPPEQLRSCQMLVERIGQMLNRLVQALRRR
jgi:four helix bundle protein